jgi:MraZ protein
VFQGATALLLDAKGRLAVPAKHRDLLNGQSGGKLVLTGHPDGCLLLYPGAAFEAMRVRLLGVSDNDPKVAAWKRVLVGMADIQEPDGQGRVLVSPVLREYAGIEKQVMLVGQGSRFEAWSDANWAKQLEQIRAQSGQPMPSAMADFTL